MVGTTLHEVPVALHPPYSAPILLWIYQWVVRIFFVGCVKHFDVLHWEWLSIKSVPKKNLAILWNCFIMYKDREIWEKGKVRKINRGGRKWRKLDVNRRFKDGLVRT